MTRVSAGLKTLVSSMLEAAAESESLVNQIAFYTQSSPDEVIEFYRAHAYSLEDIKIGTALCGKLDKVEIDRAILRYLSGGIFADVVSGSFKEFELSIAPSRPGKAKQKKGLRFGAASRFKRKVDG